MACDTESIADQPLIGSISPTSLFIIQNGAGYNSITGADLLTQFSSTVVDNGDCTFTHTSANGTVVTYDSKPTATTNADGTVVLDWCGTLSQQVVSDNIYTANGTLTGSRFVTQAGNDLNLDGRTVYGAAPYGLDAAIMVRIGYDWGVVVDGSFAGAAANFNNALTSNTCSPSYAVRTAHGKNFFNQLSNNTLVGGQPDSTYKFNVLGEDISHFGATTPCHPNGIISVTSSTVVGTISGQFRAQGTNTATNTGLLVDAQNGASNYGIQQNNGHNLLNVSSGNTAIGLPAGSIPPCKLTVRPSVGGGEPVCVQDTLGNTIFELRDNGGTGEIWLNGLQIH